MNPLLAGINLSSEQWATMLQDVASRPSEEACGLVLGEGNHSRLVIPVQNILHDPYRFRMDPQAQLDAFLLAEEKHLEIIAIYHSHPQGISQPSPTDFEELTFPGVIYLIWYQANDQWRCRAYFMEAAAHAIEVPMILLSAA